MEEELKEYEVWMEGYLATGMEGIPSEALLWGKAKAKTFKEACHIVACENFLKNTIENHSSEKYYDPDRWDYDPQACAYWGCSLYPTEREATKRFR